jgi:membrane protein YdbS with pleckstrin-like domain
VIIVPVLLILAYVVWAVPVRRYRRWGYDAGKDRLRIERGYLFYNDTVVPFGRIQHIDVDQGPIERRYDLATLSVHTAGSHNSTVTLPGLKHADALALRESIREHIKQAQG